MQPQQSGRGGCTRHNARAAASRWAHGRSRAWSDSEPTVRAPGGRGNELWRSRVGQGAFSARLWPQAIGWIDLERLRKDTPPLSGMTWPSPCRGGRCAEPPPRAEPPGCTLFLPSASSRTTLGGTPSRAFSGCSWSDSKLDIQRRSGGGECRAMGRSAGVQSLLERSAGGSRGAWLLVDVTDVRFVVTDQGENKWTHGVEKKYFCAF